MYGPCALKAVYSGASWREATGRRLDELSSDWLFFLDTIVLRKQDLAAARHRFDRPAVIRSVCVHEVARLRSLAYSCSSKGDWIGAIDLLGAAHERSNGSTATLLDLFFARVDAGQTDLARKQAKQMLDSPSISSVTRAGIRELLADLDIKSGKKAQPAAIFSELSQDAPSDEDRRRLQVKAYLAAHLNDLTEPILEMLALRPSTRRTSSPLAVFALGEAACQMPGDPIIAYLISRLHYLNEDYEGAIDALEIAVKSGLAGTGDAIWLTARMIQGEALFHMGQFKEAAGRFDALAHDTALSEGAREHARDWSERCLFYQNRA
jgi:tetratricopeptide (TPR) repeat protein